MDSESSTCAAAETRTFVSRSVLDTVSGLENYSLRYRLGSSLLRVRSSLLVLLQSELRKFDCAKFSVGLSAKFGS